MWAAVSPQTDQTKRIFVLVGGEDFSEVEGVVVGFGVEFLFDVWRDKFGADLQFVYYFAFVVDFALFDYWGFGFFGFFECKIAFFDFVGFSAGYCATIFDDFVHAVRGNVDCELVAFFDELVRVTGRADGYHENGHPPERSD